MKKGIAQNATTMSFKLKWHVICGNMIGFITIRAAFVIRDNVQLVQ